MAHAESARRRWIGGFRAGHLYTTLAPHPELLRRSDPDDHAARPLGRARRLAGALALCGAGRAQRADRIGVAYGFSGYFGSFGRVNPALYESWQQQLELCRRRL